MRSVRDTWYREEDTENKVCESEKVGVVGRLEQGFQKCAQFCFLLVNISGMF